MQCPDRLSEPVCLCPPEWRREALALLYRRVDRRLRDRAVADALAEAEGGLIDLSGLWVARRRGRLVGTLLTQALAGRAAAVWAPEVVEGWGRSATARRLLASALDHLRAEGLRIAQALLDDSAPLRAAADLTRGGLPRITTLDYLERDTSAPIEGRRRRPNSPGVRSRPRRRPSSGTSSRRPTPGASTCPSWRGSARSTT